MSAIITKSFNGNLSRVSMGDVTVWFSYETPIAFEVKGEGIIVSRNVFGSTTGKHINFVKGEAEDVTQVGEVEFRVRLESATPSAPKLYEFFIFRQNSGIELDSFMASSPEQALAKFFLVTEKLDEPKRNYTAHSADWSRDNRNYFKA